VPDSLGGKKAPGAAQNGATPERIVPEVSIPILKALTGESTILGVLGHDTDIYGSSDMGHARGNKRNGALREGFGEMNGEDLGSDWDYSYDVKPKKNRQNSVLIIDDDSDQLNMLQLMVERAGYKVITAESAEEALHLVEERPFNVIVADYKMPNMNGFDFVKALRRMDVEWNAQEVPVIVLTACGEDLEFSALEKGADMFCEKFRADSLLVKQIRFLLEL
jgi:CheY-like chemotaxis protein